MPQIQARLDLPVRKTRSCKAGKVVTPVKVEEVAEEKVKSTRSRRLLQTIEDPETLMRSPRSKRKTASKNTPIKTIETPGKRTTKRSAGECNTVEKEIEVSPSKQAKTPLKHMKENVPVAGLSPCSSLSRLALASPKVTSKRTQRAASGKLTTSPPKLTADDVSNLLDSPVKPRTPKPKPCSVLQSEPVKSLFSKSPKQLSSSQLEDLLCSPKAPLESSSQQSRDGRDAAANLFLSPGKPCRPSRTPLKERATAALFPTRSPRRVTSSQLEDLLCSPAKSPAVPRAVPCKSPRKPATPSKRVLFSPEKSERPAPPARPASVLSDISQFQSARAALHTGSPSHLLCRDQEVAQLQTWLQDHLVAGKPGSLYISGAPGTGKTASLTHLLANIYTQYKYIFINCMVLKSSIAIYREVARQLCPKKVVKTERDALKVIEANIQGSGNMILLVLDEVDQLESKDQSVLYTVFEWPALDTSRLVLCGIANSLDLTDRVLPRLQVSPAYKPTLLHYPPYSKQQIMDILRARLEEGARDQSGAPVITTRAIAFLAGKIASLSGDLRKALDVCRRALELSETIARKQSLLKPLNPRGLASPGKSPRKGYLQPRPAAQACQVDVPQIMKVINQVYGSQVSASLGTKGEGLPLKQKILVASLLLMVNKGRTKEVTLGKLSETYAKILKKRLMETEHESACVGMIQMLESRGMVTYLCKGAPRLAKITLRMDEEEVSLALGDKALLAGILEDVSCIAK